ncbi:N-formylglutamate deformylase [Devosia sp.]|uniref:N-formylglutamate deformylase n=1 Tax=Devosia sp. TaxID=1871048 RepID=UPI002FC8E382
MNWLNVTRGGAPMLVSLPHTGTEIPPAIAERLASLPLARNDTDWWIDRLYDFASTMGATVIHTTISRSVIDVNRDPSGQSLYPGQATTGLCPTTSFDGTPLYRPGAEPDDADIHSRRRDYFDPYHAALAAEIARLRADHDRIVVYDCHSIRSVVPRLFEGELPVFNIGTNDAVSCAPELQALVERHCDASGLSSVSNGRFKGGWITRNSGDPTNGIHAVQMEIACRGYMDERADFEPAAYSFERAAPVRSVLQRLFADMVEWAGQQSTQMA